MNLEEIKTLDNREIDGHFAEHVFGWKLCSIGADADGENHCQILTEGGAFPSEMAEYLPRKGKICKHFLVKNYSTDEYRIAEVEEALIAQGYGEKLIESVRQVIWGDVEPEATVESLYQLMRATPRLRAEVCMLALQDG